MNSQCPCGSGAPFRDCHGAIDAATNPAAPAIAQQSGGAAESSAVAAIDALVAQIFALARLVAEAVQSSIRAEDPDRKGAQWFRIACEALSFYIVWATKRALISRGIGTAQLLANAVGRAAKVQVVA